MPFIDLPDSRNCLFIEFLQTRKQIIHIRILRETLRPDRFIQEIIPSYDPLVLVAPCDFLPEGNPPVKIFLFHEQSGHVIHAVINIGSRLPSRRSVQIQENIQAMLFTPLYAVVHQPESFLQESYLPRLIRKEKPAV